MFSEPFKAIWLWNPTSSDSYGSREMRAKAALRLPACPPAQTKQTHL